MKFSLLLKKLEELEFFHCFFGGFIPKKRFGEALENEPSINNFIKILDKVFNK